MRTLLTAVCAAMLAGAANAAVVVQQSGSADIKFEAGSYDSITNANGAVVTDNNDGTLTTTSEDGAFSALVTYQIEFATAGDYYLYFNVDAENAAGDSVFVNHSTGFDSTPGNTNPERWNGLDDGWNGLWNIGTGLGNAQGDYQIAQPYTWTVASPGTVSFTVRAREDGLTWDSFVFSTSDTETVSNLDGLALSAVIPEPASLALIGLGGLMMLRRRRD